MRSKTYGTDLAAWASAHGLRPSSRAACLHGLMGRSLTSEVGRAEHADPALCREGRSLDLLAHATLWTSAGRPVVLLAHVHGRPAADEPGREAWVERVGRYSDRLGAQYWVARSARHTLAFYERGEAVPVLYGAPTVDLSQFLILRPGQPSREDIKRARDRERERRRVRASRSTRIEDPR